MTSLLTLNQHFEAAIQRFAPNRIALAVEEVPVTFAGLAKSVDELAKGLLAEGVRPGNVVGYSLPNCSEAIAILVAISRLGACAVPLFPMIPDAVRVGIFASMGCSLVIAAGPAVEGLSRAAERMQASLRIVELEAIAAINGEAKVSPFESSPDQRLLAAASSGTTGTPKSVWMTQLNAAAVLTATAELARVGRWQQEPDYTSMAAFPLSTSSVLVSLGMILAGVRLVFLRDMSPVRYLELAEQWNAEAMSAPPAYFESILNLPPRSDVRCLPCAPSCPEWISFTHPCSRDCPSALLDWIVQQVATD